MNLQVNIVHFNSKLFVNCCLFLDVPVFLIQLFQYLIIDDFMHHHFIRAIPTVHLMCSAPLLINNGIEITAELKPVSLPFINHTVIRGTEVWLSLAVRGPVRHSLNYHPRRVYRRLGVHLVTPGRQRNLFSVLSFIAFALLSWCGPRQIVFEFRLCVIIILLFNCYRDVL